MSVEPPPHPLYALTTYELKNYRRELEHSLKALPEHAQDACCSGNGWPRSSPSKTRGTGWTKPTGRPHCRVWVLAKGGLILSLDNRRQTAVWSSCPAVPFTASVTISETSNSG